MLFNVVEMKHPIATPNPEGNGATTWSEWLVIRTVYTPLRAYEVHSWHRTEAEAEAVARDAYYVTQER